MTARSVSWTDAESVARLLARASAPQRAAASALGFSAHIPRAQARPMPPSALAQSAATPRAPSQAPAKLKSFAPNAPRLEQVSDNPSDRIDALLAWTLDHQRCVGAFIADDNGLTLAAHGISEAHVSLVGPLLSALVAVRSVPGIDATAGALWLGTNMMSWVEARTERGGFCLGTVGPESRSTRPFEQLKEALETTLIGL
jgi:hypothetical protein